MRLVFRHAQEFLVHVGIILRLGNRLRRGALAAQNAGNIRQRVVLQLAAVAVGNATPVDLTLNKLIVEGYDAPVYDPDMEETEGGCLGDFVVQFLKKFRYSLK